MSTVTLSHGVIPQPEHPPVLLCLSLPPSPAPLATTDLFAVPIILPYSSFPLVLSFFKVILACPPENQCFQGSVGTTAAPMPLAPPSPFSDVAAPFCGLGLHTSI